MKHLLLKWSTIIIFLVISPGVYSYVISYQDEEIPVIKNIESNELVYTTGSGEVQITASIRVMDPDSKYLVSAKVEIKNNFNPNEDRLRFNSTKGISGVYNINEGTLILTGTNRTVENFRDALRAVKYENINLTNPSSGIRTIEFTVFDGKQNSDPVSRNIRINTGPQITGMESSELIYCLNYGEKNISSSIVISGAGSNTLGSASVKISGGYQLGIDKLIFSSTSEIKGIFNSLTGTLNLTGTASIEKYTEALRNVKYKYENNQNPAGGKRTVSFMVNDGYMNSNNVSRVINISVSTANISGNENICEHTFATVNVTLTGNAPWKFRYHSDAGVTTLVQSVLASPKQIYINQPGTYTLVDVTDNNNCQGLVSGSARVSIIPPPAVSIEDLQSVYSFSTVRVPVNGNPSNGSFIPRSYLIEDNDIVHFYPVVAGEGTHDIIYSYKDPVSLCYGYDTAVVNVLMNDADIIFPF